MSPAPRYDAFVQRLTQSVLDTPGDSAPAVWRAALERARGNPAGGDLPKGLVGYVDTVARHAYKVTDADVAALQQAGQSDDSLFEITVAAAVGAALHRLDRGMAALRGSGGDPD
jgi:alkylhydroperoxidase family enzyme